MALRITGLGEEIAAVTGLPWHLPLEQWPEDPALAEKRGISRHIVRLVRASNDPAAEVYAVKETVSEFANREYKILRELSHLNAPCVEQVAVVEGRVDANGEELPCAMVTRFLPYSLPYRVLLSGAVTAQEITTMASALALLLVRLHLLGFWWGDCSLSNTLFRRDAEGFAAYLVDAETGEFQKTLSDGQREHDLDIVHFNVAAELEDLALSGVLYPGMEPVRAADAVIRRYRRIWATLKERQLLDPKDRHAVERRLRDLTGLNAEELQAKRLLASFDRYNARENKLGLSIHEMAKKWISEVFEPVISRVPEEMRGRVERAQMFHEILENRWYLSEKAGYDVGLEEATDNYCNEILPMRRDSGVDIVVQ